MSYTELESGYQDLRQSTQQAQQQNSANISGERPHQQRVGFYLGHDGNADTDFGEGNDGMDSDGSASPQSTKQVIVGICAMAKKAQSKPMKEILTRLQEFEFIRILIFEEDVILKQPVEKWPLCDCLISFHSKGFPLDKAIQYAQLRTPYVLNNLHMQYDIQDRRRVYAILDKEGIEIPRYAVLDRDSPDPKQHELIESEDHVEVNGVIFNKPFVEKPVSAEDHNIYIYYPTSAGGGSQRLFRKIGSRSSVYSPESRVRKTGSFIYEDFMPTDGTDVKVYTVGPDYAHAEARKSPALDGKVERDKEGKEIRYPVILNSAEKLISRKVCMAFKQTVCGFDLLRANGKSYVCDVNGFSFVKNSNKYYDDCAKILGNMILRELTPTLHIPWSVPFQLDDPPIVPTTFGKMMELRCVVAVIRHGDRTPKQKMKVEVRHQKFFEIFEKYDGYKHGHIKLKRPKQLQEILDIARFLLAEKQSKADTEIEEKQSKLEQLKSVLEMYGHFSGINRKVQMKYQPKGRPRGSSSDDGNSKPASEGVVEPSLVLILKWGGELTPAGRIQAEELGRIFRCMYPGGQGRQDYSGTQGLGLLRLHSTFRHDLKIYASDEGRVQMTAAAFAKGLLALEGELTPILVQMVKSANTNGLLDNDCDSSKFQNLAKSRLHDLMRNDREFTDEDKELINPGNSISINQAMNFVKNPVECCNHVHSLIKELLHIINIKRDDPKTKDAILYHGETWDLMRCRWEKIEKDFSTKSKQYDISKIPDIYDCIKYDLQHNQHTLQYDQAEELYIYAKNLADIVIPQEYGLTIHEKLTIGQGICTPLLKKIKADLQRNIEEIEENANRLNPHYSHGIASPGRHVRTRLYFTSESHVHSLLTVLRYGGLLDVLTDEQWRRAMDYISMVSELNYMSQIVIMLYEDPTKDPHSEERFHVELHFSPGVNCCVQKDLPPGPGFRPHSRNGSHRNLPSSNLDEINTSRIDEENDDESPVTSSQIPRLERRKHNLSKPIPIGAHHTVSGHEAMDLAKRLNEELAHQQILKPCNIRPISPDGEPRSRSYEQHKNKEASLTTRICFDKINKKDFQEIQNVRNLKHNPLALQIRVTDNLTLFKIDSSTNELPLSEIDFSLSPSTPDNFHLHTGNSMSPQRKNGRLLTMQRMESNDETDLIRRSLHLPKISPLATNEMPLICNCQSRKQAITSGNSDLLGSSIQFHSHFKSMGDLVNHNNVGCFSEINSVTNTETQSFDDEFQLSSSAPAILMTIEFSIENPSIINNRENKFLQVNNIFNNEPTASTLKLCKAMDETSIKFDKGKKYSVLQGAQSAPIINESIRSPFSFTEQRRQFQQQQNSFINSFAPIEECIASTSPSDEGASTPKIPSQQTCAGTKPRQRKIGQALQAPIIFKETDKSPITIIVPDVIITSHNPSRPTSPINIKKTVNYFKQSVDPTFASEFEHSKLNLEMHSQHKQQEQLAQRSFDTNNTLTSFCINASATIASGHTTNTTTSTTTTIDGSVTSTSASSSVSRRQRHSIAGQMTYMKMLGFNNFSRKMATSTNSLFSTAVISGSSSAPNLRDMIPVSSAGWSKQSSLATNSTEEPSSPAILPPDTPSIEFSLSISEAECSRPAIMELASFNFPPVQDDELNNVSVYTPMNMDTLDIDSDNVFLSTSGSDRGDKSASLTPVSQGMDISMIANKGSMTLSVDGFEDDDEATLSAATTPCLPIDDPKLETCFCCAAHAEQGEPPDVEEEDQVVFMLPDCFNIPNTNIIKASPEHNSFHDRHNMIIDTTNAKYFKCKATDPISPKIQKQISLFETGNFDRQKDSANLHASINLPAPGPHQLRQDVRLRKFENLTQSTSNSNFPFESNTLKRVPNQTEFPDCSHTQSCLNLKTSISACPSPSSMGGSPQHKNIYKPVVQSFSTVAIADQKHPGALYCKEKFIEPPRRIARHFGGKTQSMDADFLCNEFLLVPALAPSQTILNPPSTTGSISPIPRSNTSRFIATKVLDDIENGENI